MVTAAVDARHAEAAHKVLATPDLHLILALGGDHLGDGLAALDAALGSSVLRPHFAAVAAKRLARSEDIECHLLTRTGQPDCVDAFHRFVYGFADPSPLTDLWLRDDAADLGANDWPGRFWDSPDLWVRNRDDGGLEHQNLEYGQDNWIHARVRNRSTSSTARHLVVSFNIRQFAGSQFT